MNQKDLARLGYLMSAVALSTGAPVVAEAATLANLSSPAQTCGTSSGVWHFVNNQTGGAAAGSLSALFTGPNSGCTTGPRLPVNASVQHFYCTAAGTLFGAATNLPGRLVLSDYTCTTPPPPPPPPCDIKVDPKCVQ